MKLLGVRIDNVTLSESLALTERLILDGKRHYIVTPNPEFLVDAQRDPLFLEILNAADLAIPDGTGLIIASKLLGDSLKCRVSGVDFMEALCNKASSSGWGVFLLGGGAGVAEKAARVLVRRYPGLRVLGCYGGNREAAYDETSLAEIRRRVGRARIDILLVAYGHPYQEKWIRRNLSRLNVGVAVGVGGSFDFIAGKTRRAPRILRRLGLEWLFRLLVEPWRWRRILRAVFVFPLLVMGEIFRGGIRSTKKSPNVGSS